MKARIPRAGGNNRAAMLEQVQRAQQQMQDTQATLEETEYTGEAAGGQITVTVDGKHTVRAVHIDPAMVDPEDVEMLEDFVAVAVNDAVGKAAADYEEKMGAITGGLNIPGLL